MKKALMFIFIFTSFLFFPLLFVEANMEPKPLTSIRVEGIKGNYTAALAAKSVEAPNYSFNKENINDDSEYHPIMEYKDDDGFFWITKYQRLRNDDTFTFFEYPPSTFKLIIMLDDGTILVSQVCTRFDFESFYIVNVDVTKTNVLLTLNMVTSNFSNLSNIAIRIALSIIIELVILLFLNIKSKSALLVFITVNMATQLFLNMSLSLINHYQGVLVAVNFYLFLKILIFIIETISYILFIKNESKFKLVVYSLIANSLSFFVGMLIFIDFSNI